MRSKGRRVELVRARQSREAGLKQSLIEVLYATIAIQYQDFNRYTAGNILYLTLSVTSAGYMAVHKKINLFFQHSSFFISFSASVTVQITNEVFSVSCSII
jgi:hypothetical protein